VQDFLLVDMEMSQDADTRVRYARWQLMCLDNHCYHGFRELLPFRRGDDGHDVRFQPSLSEENHLRVDGLRLFGLKCSDDKISFSTGVSITLSFIPKRKSDTTLSSAHLTHLQRQVFSSCKEAELEAALIANEACLQDSCNANGGGAGTQLSDIGALMLEQQKLMQEYQAAVRSAMTGAASGGARVHRKVEFVQPVELNKVFVFEGQRYIVCVPAALEVITPETKARYTDNAQRELR